jgi:hypothetical protein
MHLTIIQLQFWNEFDMERVLLPVEQLVLERRVQEFIKYPPIYPFEF